MLCFPPSNCGDEIKCISYLGGQIIVGFGDPKSKSTELREEGHPKSSGYTRSALFTSENTNAEVFKKILDNIQKADDRRKNITLAKVRLFTAS